MDYSIKLIESQLEFLKNQIVGIQGHTQSLQERINENDAQIVDLMRNIQECEKSLKILEKQNAKSKNQKT